MPRRGDVVSRLRGSHRRAWWLQAWTGEGRAERHVLVSRGTTVRGQEGDAR